MPGGGVGGGSTTSSSINNHELHPLPWESAARRSSSMSMRRCSLLSSSLFDSPLHAGRHVVAECGADVVSGDSDPFAPLSINEGFTIAKQPPQPPLHSLSSYQSPFMERDLHHHHSNHNLRHNSNHHHHHLKHPGASSAMTNFTTTSSSSSHPDYFLSDRSESSGASVPSLTASSFGSPRSAQSSSSSAANNLYAHYHHNAMSMAALVTPPTTTSASAAAVTATATTTAQATPPQLVSSMSQGMMSSGGGSAGACPDDDDDEDELNQHRFKSFHMEKWSLRYKELLEFHKEHGHAAVPHTYPRNPQLARWVKRQRRQYKLRRDGRPSTMTTERLEMLDSVGFVWDSHDVNWREKLDGLETFRAEHGHCNVPSNFRDKKLATWVKCQRRQYKLYWDGKPSAMSPDRIQELEKLGFEWELRSTVTRNNSNGSTSAATAASAAAAATTSVPGRTPAGASSSTRRDDFNLLYDPLSDM